MVSIGDKNLKLSTFELQIIRRVRTPTVPQAIASSSTVSLTKVIENVKS